MSNERVLYSTVCVLWCCSMRVLGTYQLERHFKGKPRAYSHTAHTVEALNAFAPAFPCSRMCVYVWIVESGCNRCDAVATNNIQTQ